MHSIFIFFLSQRSDQSTNEASFTTSSTEDDSRRRREKENKRTREQENKRTSNKAAKKSNKQHPKPVCKQSSPSSAQESATQMMSPGSKRTRLLKTVNPLRLTPVEFEYLSSVALHFERHNFFQTSGFTIIDKLNPSDDLLTKVRNAGLMSTRGPRMLSLIYSTNPSCLEIEENVKIVTLKSGTRQQLDFEALIKGSVERIAHLVLEDLNNVREGLYPLPSELKLMKKVGPSALLDTIKEMCCGCKFGVENTYSGNSDYSAPNEPSSYLKQLASGLDVPDYYMIDYHSVPGGFLSPEHVSIYDTLSETVFLGTHFMARRMVLRPLAKIMKYRGQNHQNGQGFKLLDLGTGNGSFMMQLREAFPKLELCGVDLSPAMLEFSKKSFQSMCGSAPFPKLIRASMTNIPIDDDSFDFVTETNCFHEMPESAISDTAKEIARVLKPDGLFVHLDAVQMCDDPSIASASRVTFDKQFNEPYMFDWMEKVNLDKIFESQGMVPARPPHSYHASTVRCYRKFVD